MSAPSIEECIKGVEQLDKKVFPLKGSVRREILRVIRSVKEKRDENERELIDGNAGRCWRACDGCEGGGR